MSDNLCDKCRTEPRAGRARLGKRCLAAARKEARAAQDGERAYLVRELELRGVPVSGEPDVAELKRLLAGPVAVAAPAPVTAPAVPVSPPEPSEPPAPELTYGRSSYATREPRKSLKGQVFSHGTMCQCIACRAGRAS